MSMAERSKPQVDVSSDQPPSYELEVEDIGMRVGGRRRITTPPMLAYGKRGAGGVIGPDETLVSVVDLIGLR